MTTVKNTSFIEDSTNTNIETLVKNLGITQNFQSSVYDLINNNFSIDGRIIGEILKEVREEQIFEGAGIEADGAISDLVPALQKGSFVSIAQLAYDNESQLYETKSFEAYAKILKKFGLNVTEYYLQQLPIQK